MREIIKKNLGHRKIKPSDSIGNTIAQKSTKMSKLKLNESTNNVKEIIKNAENLHTKYIPELHKFSEFSIDLDLSFGNFN